MLIDEILNNMNKLLHKLRYVFKPRELFQRLGEKSKNSLRISKLRNTPAENLNKLQINSLEFLEIIQKKGAFGLRSVSTIWSQGKGERGLVF